MTDYSVGFLTKPVVGHSLMPQLLSRAQTEEWKGWMQFAFIMYHYYRAYSVYNVIRVFVSAYVWMTGKRFMCWCHDFGLRFRRGETSIIQSNLRLLSTYS